MSVQKRKAARKPRRNALSAKDTRAAFPTLVKGALAALPLTLTVGLLLLFSVTALLLATKNPERFRTPAAFAALYLTAAVGGALAVRFCRRSSPLFCGVAEGALLLLTLFLLSLFLPETLRLRAVAVPAFLTRFAVLPASLAGAWLVGRRHTHRR